MDVCSHIIEGMQQNTVLLDAVLPIDKNVALRKNNAESTPPLDVRLERLEFTLCACRPANPG